MQANEKSNVSPRPLATRRKRVDWLEVWTLALMCCFAFVCGVILVLRLTDGGNY